MAQRLHETFAEVASFRIQLDGVKPYEVNGLGGNAIGGTELGADVGFDSSLKSGPAGMGS